MATLTDEDLAHLLGEAAGSFPVPEQGRQEVLDEACGLPVPRLRRRRVQLLAAAAAVVVGAGVVGAVLQTSSPQTAQVASPAAASANQRTGASAGDAGTVETPAGAIPDGDTAQLAGLVPQAAAAPANERSVTGAGGVAAPAAPMPAAPQPPSAPQPDGARVVKTGAIALVVDDGRVTPVLTQVQGLATSAGGVVASAKTQESGPTPSGSVTLRVPVERFEEVVSAVRQLDAEVRTATTSGQDVTAGYADLEAQLRTLRAARERFLDILSRARSIGDVLAVQQRVDDVTGQIDRLEGARRVLASQSEKATLEVSVTEADDPAVRTSDKPDDGLSKAFSDAWDGFTGGIEALIRASGRALVIALCLAIAYVLGRLAWRASRRRLV